MKNQKIEYEAELFIACKLPKGIIPPNPIVKGGRNYTKVYAAFYSQFSNENSSKAYVGTLLAFMDYLDLTHTKIRNVGIDTVTSYLAYRRNPPPPKRPLSPYSVKLHIAVIKEFFRISVLAGVRKDNPIDMLKKRPVRRKLGTTEYLAGCELSAVLDFEIRKHSDLRDKALLSTMALTFYRISAVLNMKVSDYRRQTDGYWFYALEKGDKIHSMPADPHLAYLMNYYLTETNLRSKPQAFLFPNSHGPSGVLYPNKRHNPKASWAMAKRRAIEAGIDPNRSIGNHSFRASGITAFIERGGTLDEAADLANHEYTTTTKLYDRSKKKNRRSLLSKY